MLGLGDWAVSGGYLLSLISVMACCVYGIANWNKGGNPDEDELTEERRWQKEEDRLESDIEGRDCP